MRAKVCRICRRGLPISHFYAKSSGLYGVDTICRHCGRYEDWILRHYRKSHILEKDIQRTINEWKTIMGKREREPARDCNSCADRDLCEMRVRMGLWVLCEKPDEGDMRRIRSMHIEGVDWVDVGLTNNYEMEAVK